MSHRTYTFTSESVTEGHPDKVCDLIADAILDAHLEADPRSRVACEVLAKSNMVVVAGEITSNGSVAYVDVAKDTIRRIGYTDSGEQFNADGVMVVQHVSRQSSDIALGVDESTNSEHDQGAGDQGIMFGYATNETPELMPLPILLAHKLARGLADDRRSGLYPWLRPDGKTQVSVVYENEKPTRVSDVLVSTQHGADVDQAGVMDYVRGTLVPRVLNSHLDPKTRILANPTGRFVDGGPSADCGVTGRKIIVDTYGGAARHGGGALSGKDPSKVDRSGAYFCRYVARQVVKAGLAERAEIQVAYAIGVAKPVSVKVDTFGTGDHKAAGAFVANYDFRPAAIIEQLRLRRPIYSRTTNYGHFGKPDLPWEV